jgi:hypothetical protein
MSVKHRECRSAAVTRRADAGIAGRFQGTPNGTATVEAIEAQEGAGALPYPANLYRRIRDLLGRELIAESEAPQARTLEGRMSRSLHSDARWPRRRPDVFRRWCEI